MKRLIRWGQPGKTNVVRPGEPIVSHKPASGAPTFKGTIPALNLTQNVAMQDYDASAHYRAATSYSISELNAGLTFDTEFGIIKGTPTALDTTNPIVSGINAHGDTESNQFTITVTA